MASLMEDLLDVLGKEEAEYQKLVEIAEQKRDAVIKGDIGQLGEVTIKEQDAASELLNLSHKRTQVLTDMAVVLGKDPNELTITKMIGYLEKQPTEQEKLTKQRDRLLEVGSQMRILKQALEMVEFDLTLLKSMRQAPETANYDKNAYNTGDILGSSGFDAKQ